MVQTISGKAVDYFDLLINFKFGLKMIAFFLASMAGAGLSGLLLSLLALKSKRFLAEKNGVLSKLVYLTRHFLEERSRKFQLFSLFVIIFFWFGQTIFTSNIKVEVWISLCFIDY